MNKRRSLIYLIMLILIIPAIIALLHSGFFVTDDGSWMVIRFSSFYQMLRNGQFPVRFLAQLNHGYGYPVADFLYPGYMYLGIPIHVIGFGFINTIKFILGSSIVASGFFTYLWLRKRFSDSASLVGSLLYVFYPYHLFDIYQRGSVGEVLALAIVPFICWQIEQKSTLFISLSIGFLILSHNTLALLFLPVLLAYMWLLTYPIKKIIGIILFSLGISAFFWIPALYDKQYTVFDSVSVSDFSHYFITQKSSSFLGLITPLVLSLACYVYFRRQTKDIIFFLTVTVIAGFFILPISQILWPLFHLNTFVQFPFRFISLMIPCIAYLAASVMQSMNKKYHVVWGSILIVIMYISAWSYLFPKQFTSYPDDYYATNQDTTTVKNEYMPLWVKQPPLSAPSQKIVLLSGAGTLNNQEDKGTSLRFHVSVTKNTLIQINTIYFPGWNLLVNNKKVPLLHNNNQGVIQLFLLPGNYDVYAFFGETPLRLVCDIISVVFLFILLGTPLLRKKKFFFI